MATATTVPVLYNIFGSDVCDDDDGYVLCNCTPVRCICTGVLEEAIYLSMYECLVIAVDDRTLCQLLSVLVLQYK
jgi:hypothetical protein